MVGSMSANDGRCEWDVESKVHCMNGHCSKEPRLPVHNVINACSLGDVEKWQLGTAEKTWKQNYHTEDAMTTHHVLGETDWYNSECDTRTKREECWNSLDT